ncbi:hypothetical protein M3Y98_01228000 [Aphelenchoides besseyi]|nr:hypothetical protein M3Y98_01228000 [Aphelenchoides besseyi]KAI6193417.1 hypothetical protein M3Y96_01015500 [Aphelenchoides besseyi]
MTVIRILFPEYPPGVTNLCASFPALHVSTFCHWPGLMIEVCLILITMIILLTRDANLTIQPLVVEDLGFEHNMERFFDDKLFQFISNGTIDTIALPFQKTDERESSFSFTESLYKVQTRAIKRITEKHQYNKIWAFFETYDGSI